jgi:hypothetical protein
MEKKFVACVTCGKEVHAVFAERNNGHCLVCVRTTGAPRESRYVDYAATMNEIAQIKKQERSAFVDCVACGQPANKGFAQTHQGKCLKCSGHDFARPVKQVHICTACNKNQVYNLKNGQICIPCRNS